MPTALIIGASRGIGLELACQYVAQGWRVIATARKEIALDLLTGMGAEAHALDVMKVADCAALGWTLEGEQLDAAFLCAGVYGPKTEGLAFPLDRDFDQVMHTNVLAAMRLLPVIGPLVCEAKGKLAVMSSIMASLSLRSDNNGWLYRASKAALNSVLVDAALEFGEQGATCVAFHPGWVQTDMGGPDADIPVTESVTALRTTLAALRPEDNGKFLNYDGTPLSW